MIENKIRRQTVDCRLPGISSGGLPRKNGKTKLEEPQQALEPNAWCRRRRRGTSVFKDLMHLKNMSNKQSLMVDRK
jgi:hypothetical protein